MTTIIMWNKSVKCETFPAMPSPVAAGEMLGEVWLHIPESLHQHLEGGKPLRIVTKDQKAGLFVETGLDPETGKHIYEARFIYTSEDVALLSAAGTKYAHWKVDEDGQMQLVWKAD